MGLDIYKSVGEVIKRKGGIGIRGNASEIPISGNSFDICICCEMLEHVPDPNVCLEEMYRVVRPGGKLIITIPSYFNLWIVPMILARMGNKYFQHYMDYQLMENLYAVKNVRKFMKKNFYSVNQRAIRLEPPLINKIFSHGWFHGLKNSIERMEESYGGSILKHHGLHTLFWAIK